VGGVLRSSERFNVLKNVPAQRSAAGLAGGGAVFEGVTDRLRVAAERAEAREAAYEVSQRV
jgi:hypothetical protein